MKRKATKGYWSKKKERFTDGREARMRAGTLRNDEYTAHVQVLQQGDEYHVCYSIPIMVRSRPQERRRSPLSFWDIIV